MRFSTRNTRKRGKSLIFAASAAVLGLGGIVSYIYKNNAQAEVAPDNEDLFYARVADYSSINEASAAARTALGVDDVQYCSLSGAETVTRVNFDTAQNDTFWVIAKATASCPSAAEAADYVLNANGATILPKKYADTYMGQERTNDLGALGSFHILGFEQINLDAQTYGNVLTADLDHAHSLIGHQDWPAISYARQLGDTISSSFSFANEHNSTTNVLVVGPNAPVGANFNEDGHYWTVNGSKVNMPARIIDNKYANNLWQEASGSSNDRFLDIDALQTSAESWSRELASYSDTLTSADYDFSDPNNKVINIPSDSKNKLNVLTLSKEDISGNSVYINVRGFDQNTPGTLVINIDLGNDTSFTMNNSFRLCYQSNEIKYSDSVDSNGCLKNNWIHDQYENHIIVNFFSKNPTSGTISTYEHDLEIARETTSFIVAPDADLNITASTIQGVLMANTIHSNADTYYLSLNNASPLRREAQCTITVNHLLINTDEVVAPQETKTVTCGSETKEVKWTTSFNDISKRYNTREAYYLENGNEEVTSSLPMSVDYDSTQRTYNLYYEEAPKCTITVNHLLYGASERTEVAPSETATYYCETNTDVYSKTVDWTTTFTRTPVGEYVHVSADYNGVQDITNEIPKVVAYSASMAEYNLYYQDACTFVLHHVNKTTGVTIRDDAPITRTCGEIIEYGHAEDLITTSGFIPVTDAGYAYDPGTMTTIPIGVNGRPTEATVYYKTGCVITVEHRLKDSQTKLADDETYTGFCSELDATINISQAVLNKGYAFDNALENTSDDHFHESEFPLTVTDTPDNLNYIIEYTAKTCVINVLHKNKNTGQIIGSHSYTDSASCPVKQSKTITPLTAITDLGYTFDSASFDGPENSTTITINSDAYFENTATEFAKNATISKESFPITTRIDQDEKIITLYYTPNTCVMRIYHKDIETGEVIDNNVETFSEQCPAQNEHAIAPLDSILENDYHFVDGTYDGPEDETIVTTNTDDYIESTTTAFDKGYHFDEGLFPLASKNNETEKIFTVYYAKIKYCSITVHHYLKGTTDKLAKDQYYLAECDTINPEISISEAVLNKGYKFSSAKLESERIVSDYEEKLFPFEDRNDYDKVFTIYYEMPEKPKNPDTSSKHSAILFSATGASIALGAVFFIHRRRQA